MKAIIFDVDWVITLCNDLKNETIKKVMIKHGLYNLEWVQEILKLRLNRKIFLPKIKELHHFDIKIVLDDLNYELSILEKNPEPNFSTIDFIKSNSDKYQFFTNTSLPLLWLNNILKALDLDKYFVKKYTWETGSKIENTQSIMNEFGFKKNEVLFIDDTLIHVENVSKSWVNTLHFDNKDINIQLELLKY